MEGTVESVPEPPLEADLWPSQNPFTLAPLGEGYLLAWGTDNIRAVELSATGAAAGPVMELSPGGLRAADAAISGGPSAVVVYMRELYEAYQPRWRLFTRAIFEEQPRRRAVARR
jgi:hypothetical protein